MNSLLISLFLSLLVFSIVSIQLTSSASFPNPPQLPSPNAPADEWTLFWKLLHNYYAIIARPRFGKRYDSMMTQSKHPSILSIINPNSRPLSSSENEFMLSENNRNANDEQINLNELYTLTDPDRRQRRRQQ